MTEFVSIVGVVSKYEFKHFAETQGFIYNSLVNEYIYLNISIKHTDSFITINLLKGNDFNSVIKLVLSVIRTYNCKISMLSAIFEVYFNNLNLSLIELDGLTSRSYLEKIVKKRIEEVVTKSLEDNKILDDYGFSCILGHELSSFIKDNNRVIRSVRINIVSSNYTLLDTMPNKFLRLLYLILIDIKPRASEFISSLFIPFIGVNNSIEVPNLSISIDIYITPNSPTSNIFTNMNIKVPIKCSQILNIG